VVGWLGLEPRINGRKDSDALKEKVGFGSPTEEEKKKTAAQAGAMAAGRSSPYRDFLPLPLEWKTASWAGNS